MDKKAIPELTEKDKKEIQQLINEVLAAEDAIKKISEIQKDKATKLNSLLYKFCVFIDPEVQAIINKILYK